MRKKRKTKTRKQEQEVFDVWYITVFELIRNRKDLIKIFVVKKENKTIQNGFGMESVGGGGRSLLYRR